MKKKRRERRQKSTTTKARAEYLLTNDVQALQLQAGMEVHWGQTVQAAEMDCMGALDPLQPHKHHSALKCSNLLYTCLF